jgi:hypothetical protein
MLAGLCHGLELLIRETQAVVLKDDLLRLPMIRNEEE